MSSILGIIPARGGSKGIPRKNIIDLGGKPLLYYTIKAAKEAGILDRLVLSSEDAEIIDLAKSLDVEVPFVRPAKYAQDHVGDQPVLKHALNTLKELDGYQPDMVLYLKPTIPFRSSIDIKNVIKKLKERNVDSVRTVTETTGVNHPYWMFTMDEDGLSHPLISGKSVAQYPRRQLLPPVFRLNGVVEGLKPEFILHHDSIYGKKMALVTVPEDRAVDIDTPADLDYARYLLSKTQSP